MELRVAGEGALVLYLGDAVDERVLANVQAATAAIEATLGDELVDLVPSYASVLVIFNPLRRTHVQVARQVRAAVNALAASAAIEWHRRAALLSREMLAPGEAARFLSRAM